MCNCTASTNWFSATLSLYGLAMVNKTGARKGARASLIDFPSPSRHLEVVSRGQTSDFGVIALPQCTESDNAIVRKIWSCHASMQSGRRSFI